MPNKLIKLSGISKNFGGVQALDNVNFIVEEGELLGLIGPNGAGKSTLFNIISGVYKFDKGKIIFKDNEIQDFKDHEISQKGIARTFQIARPFLGLTVLENVLVGLGKESYRTGFKFFESYNKEHYINKAKKILKEVKLFDYIEEEASKLSLGHKRRLGIARALALYPKILMLDEPLAGLGTDSIDEMLNLIKELNQKGITIILVEHNMDAIMKVCNRILVLNKGKIIAKGSPSEIQSNEEVIEAYLGKGDKNA